MDLKLSPLDEWYGETYEIRLTDVECGIDRRVVWGFIDHPFALRGDGDIWRIDHIPTGCSLGIALSKLEAYSLVWSIVRLTGLESWYRYQNKEEPPEAIIAQYKSLTSLIAKARNVVLPN